MKYLVILLCFVALLFSGCKRNPEYYIEQGKACWRDNEREEAVRYFKRAADKGSVQAERIIVWAYLQGLDGKPDYVKSREYALPLANAGEVRMQVLMGQFYEYGHGVKKDAETALKWYEKAAAENFNEAYCAIARIYEEGKLGKPDSAKAEEYLKKAIKHGSTLAENNLAYIWAEAGKNLKEAEKLSRRAVHDEPKNAAYLDTLGWIYFKQGKYELAKKYLEEAVELFPNHSCLQEHLGDALAKLGKYGEAVDHWYEALQHTKDEKKRECLNRKIKSSDKKSGK